MRLNLLGCILLLALGIFQYRLWIEPSGIKDILRLKRKLAIQKDQNASLKKENDELLFQVKRLQNNKNATESRARNELGMIKKGETFYRIIDSKKTV